MNNATFVLTGEQIRRVYNIVKFAQEESEKSLKEIESMPQANSTFKDVINIARRMGEANLKMLAEMKRQHPWL